MMASKKNRDKQNHQVFRKKLDASTKRDIGFKKKSRDTQNAGPSQDKQNHQRNDGKNSRRVHSIKFALSEFDRAKNEKMRLKAQIEKRRQELKIATEKYNQKKLNRNKKLMPRTSKGQPIMKNRIELLLEKIQSSI